MSSVSLTLIAKPGCHLCDEARAEIERVLASEQLASAGVVPALAELNILEHEELLARHVEEIPVVLINGKMHTYWRVDPVRLTAAILKASSAA